jgi:hypothetical protein
MRTASGGMFVFRSVQNTKFCPQPPGIGFTAVRKTNALHTSFTGNCRSFAEYRVSTCRIALKIPPSKET